MIGILVVTHGDVARELVNALKMIVGEQERILALSIDWEDDVDVAKGHIGKALAKCGRKNVLVLTDMFGGTPTNLVLPFAGEGVEVVTGVNLPMLIKACQVRTKPLAEVARIVCAQGRQSVQIAGDLLQPGGRTGESSAI
jgi:PTS system mannose-specific IIA component